MSRLYISCGDILVNDMEEAFFFFFSNFCMYIVLVFLLRNHGKGNLIFSFFFPSINTHTQHS